MISEEVKNYIDKSVLCWLATSNSNNEPNVSPKEMFTWKDENTLLIAHIASPETVRNIRENEKVCVSFVDVFVQKGFKLKGIAKIISKEETGFSSLIKPLTDLFSDQYPVKALIEVTITRVDRIQAPSYFLFPDTTEEKQVEQAMRTYHVKPG